MVEPCPGSSLVRNGAGQRSVAGWRVGERIALPECWPAGRSLSRRVLPAARLAISASRSLRSLAQPAGDGSEGPVEFAGASRTTRPVSTAVSGCRRLAGQADASRQDCGAE
ncbi:MAG: hypothetical protein J7448_10590, partial [Thermomicrobium sp.]|nr:hypothetical protein [Thermomicrobium sp.]